MDADARMPVGRKLHGRAGMAACIESLRQHNHDIWGVWRANVYARVPGPTPERRAGPAKNAIRRESVALADHVADTEHPSRRL